MSAGGVTVSTGWMPLQPVETPNGWGLLDPVLGVQPLRDDDLDVICSDWLAYLRDPSAPPDPRPGLGRSIEVKPEPPAVDEAPTAPAVDPAKPPPGMSTALYRRFDEAGVLLYVGVSDAPARRDAAHRRKSSWASYAVRSTYQWFATREEAEQAEAGVIQAERPLFNHLHNADPEARSRLVAYLIEKGRLDLLAPAVSRG